MLFLAPPSHAGGWSTTYTGTNNESLLLQPRSDYPTLTDWLPYTRPSVPFSTDDYLNLGDWWTDGYGEFQVGDQWIASENEDFVTSGDITATLTWHTDWGKTLEEDPPPKTLTLLESGRAWWQSYYYGLDMLGANYGTADNGLGDAMVISSPYDFPSASGLSFGRHIIQVDSSSGKVVLHRVQSVTTPACQWVAVPQFDFEGGLYLTYGFDWGYNFFEHTYNVKQDDRAVTISADVDATNYKLLSGGLDANGDGNVARVANARAADGTMKGDVSPGYGDPNYNIDFSYFTVTYKANLIGNWAMKGSLYLWNSSYKNYSSSGVVTAPPPDDDIPLLTNKYRKPYLLYTDATTPAVHELGDVTNSDGPNRMPDHIFFKYQNGDNRGTALTTGNDGDGAVATANYYLTIHQPDEIFPSNKHGFLTPGPPNIENMVYYDLSPSPRTGTKDQLMSVSNGGFVTSGFGATGTWNFPGAFWDNAAAVLGAVANAPYPARLSYAGLTIAAIGVAVDKIGPKADSAPINLDQTAYDDPMSTFPATHPKGTEPITNYRLYPKVHVWFKRYYTLHDTYDMTGFVGETLEYTDIFQSYGSVYGEFQSLADSPHS